ncbi:MAG: hypothetical protein ACOC2Y_09420, partial [Spirochaetota bacterium]
LKDAIPMTKSIAGLNDAQDAVLERGAIDDEVRGLFAQHGITIGAVNVAISEEVCRRLETAADEL